MARESLRGQVALITGAAKRIGRETAVMLAGEGVDVIIHYNRSAGEAETLAASLTDLGVRAWTIQADFEKREEYETLIERAITLAGSLDILINNASIFPPDRMSTVTFDHLITNMEVNAWVPFLLSRSFAAQRGHGKIINLLDSRLKGDDFGHVAYILSKHLLAEFTRMCALEFAPGITVNGVAPGLILPPAGKDERYLDALAHTVPLQRHGDPEGVAEAILYLLKSPFITGNVIYVDGGRHLLEYRGGPNPHS